MGLICRACHTYNRGSKKYCRKCKKLLVLGRNFKKCLHCNFINPKSVKRCIKCGKKFSFFYGIEAATKARDSMSSSSSASQKTVIKKSRVKIQPKKTQNVNSGIVWKDVWNELQKLNSTNSKQNNKTTQPSFEQFNPKKISRIAKIVIWIYVIIMVLGFLGEIIGSL